MPIVWKILFKKFLFYLFFLTLFFLFLTIFFKLSRLTKYFLSGIDLKEIFLLLSLFIYRLIPFALSITSFISAYLCTLSMKKDKEIFAFCTLGLSPFKLFTPMIAISIFLSIFNVGTVFILGPLLTSSLNSLLEEKKSTMTLLSSFSKRFNRKDVYVYMNNRGNKTKDSDFLFVRSGKKFSWILCDLIEEDKEGLILHNSSFFTSQKEEGDFNSIALSENKLTFIPKSTIFSLFPSSTLKLSSIFPEEETKYLSLIYLCHPFAFTIFGIIIALSIFKVASFIFFSILLILFILSTLSLQPFVSSLSFISLIFIFPYYLLSMLKFKKEPL